MSQSNIDMSRVDQGIDLEHELVSLKCPYCRRVLERTPRGTVCIGDKPCYMEPREEDAA